MVELGADFMGVGGNVYFNVERQRAESGFKDYGIRLMDEGFFI